MIALLWQTQGILTTYQARYRYRNICSNASQFTLPLKPGQIFVLKLHEPTSKISSH
ncbi:hypothetical protein C942_02488 [Photobacterium marinum]|uniref:Uncharacterized protein n=1 Tax=Photobacterium marinum TaxID=1056511 RepID=L8JA79_9GAMM|nr:hypothetical protein C942_02488 [Photobacterium marinum]